MTENKHLTKTVQIFADVVTAFAKLPQQFVSCIPLFSIRAIELKEFNLSLLLYITMGLSG